MALARARWSFPLDPGAHLSDGDDEMTADSSSSSSFEVSDAMARRDRAMSATRKPESEARLCTFQHIQYITSGNAQRS